MYLLPGADSSGSNPVPGFPAAPVCLAAAAQRCKQKHYGCHSVSHSGNTVSQLKHTDNKRLWLLPAPLTNHSTVLAGPDGQKLGVSATRAGVLGSFSPAVKSFCLISS